MAPIWRITPTVEQLQATSSNSAAEHLGIEFLELGDNWVRARMPVDARTRQPMGLLHGGASVLLAETLGSVAGMLCLDMATHYCVGLEINANHIRGVSEGWVIGTAEVVHIGRTTQVWSIRIENEQGKLVCLSRLTMAVVARS